MTETDRIIFTSEVAAVVEAIFQQRAETIDDIVKYDEMKTQKMLYEKGVFTKEKTTPIKQLEIIDDLTKKGILKTDRIVDVDWINKYRKAFYPNQPLLESDQKYYWANQSEWAIEYLQLNGLMTIKQAFKSHGSSLYIYITQDDMDYIEYNYMPSHTMEAGMNLAHHCLRVRFDGGKWHNLTSLDPTKNPYKILRYAYQHSGQTINRKFMFNSKLIDTEDYLKSRVFSDNRPVQVLCPLFIDVDKFDITFNTDPEPVTLAEIDYYKSKLKIK